MKRLLLLGLIALAAIGALAIPTYAYFSSFQGYKVAQSGEQERPPLAMRIQRCLPKGLPRVEVSEDFRLKAQSIAEGDGDVQRLLSEGYNITWVRPIIKAVVQGDGTVTLKATQAILVLTKNSSGLAHVEVNIEAGKVTKITILSRTVIEKGS